MYHKSCAHEEKMSTYDTLRYAFIVPVGKVVLRCYISCFTYKLVTLEKHPSQLLMIDMMQWDLEWRLLHRALRSHFLLRNSCDLQM